MRLIVRIGSLKGRPGLPSKIQLSLCEGGDFGLGLTWVLKQASENPRMKAMKIRSGLEVEVRSSVTEGCMSCLLGSMKAWSWVSPRLAEEGRERKVRK